MQMKVEKIKEEIEQLRNQINILENQVKDIQQQCEHQFIGDQYSKKCVVCNKVEVLYY